MKTIPVLGYTWTPPDYLDDPSSPNPVTSTPDSITYYLDALAAGANIIKNGNFSAGNTDFTSGYSYTNINVAEGEYFVGNNASSWNGSFSNCADHTTGDGNMMIVNGSPTVDVPVWTQNITVIPNTEYAFSAWIQSLWPPNPAQLRFSINGTDIGNVITAPNNTCEWTQFYSVWNSGANTSATISIVNKNTTVIGNDFALDDISFAGAIKIRDSITIRVEKTFVTTSNDTSFCIGGAAPLNTTGASSYSWSPATGLTDINTANPTATPILTTEYIVTGTSANGCIAKDSVNIIVNPKPIITLTPDTLICRYIPLQISASGGTTYTWFPSTGLNDPTIANPVAITSQNIDYAVLVTDNNNCFSKDSIQVSVRPYPVFAASGAQTICNGTPITLKASGGDNYQWSPANLFDDPAAASPVTAPAANTLYTVNISENTCNNDTAINLAVIVHPIPIVSATKSNDLNCNTPTAQLQASGAQSYTWSQAASLDDPTSISPTTAADTTTRYELKGTNSFGCSSSTFITVYVDKGGIPRFVVPNAFTPNGDGKNDCFGIRRWGNAVIHQFAIYNRWGQLVFQTSTPYNCWDGTFKGKPQDAGGYAYIIRASTLCGEVTRKGILTLIR